jgi:Na+/H+-dicarboxylate symporter
VRWHRQLHWRIIAGLLLGVGYGVLAAVQGWGAFTRDWVSPFGTVFLNALKLIAVPLVLASLITGVASLSDLRKLSRIGGKTIAIYMATTVVAIVIGLAAVNLARPGRFVPAAMRAELQQAYEADAAAGDAAAASAQDRGPLQLLVDIVPDNVVSAAGSNSNMLQVVFVALLFGIGLVLIPRETGKPLLDVIEGVNQVVIRLVDVIMLIAPVGVFALIAGTITTVAGDDPGRVARLVGALGVYCGVVILGLAVHTLVVYPTMLRLFARMPARRFFSAIAPAQLVAFSTSSSGATLPVTMERCEQELGVPEEVSSFVLPLGATINMDGTALYQAVAAVFISQALGMELGLTGQLTIILTALLASIGTAAVPGAGIIMLVIILESVGIPSAGIALILGVDRILDMLRTVTNVTGDATVATIVAASEGSLRTWDVPAEGEARTPALRFS